MEGARDIGIGCVEGGDWGISTTFFPPFLKRGCSSETVTFGSSANHFCFPFPSSIVLLPGVREGSIVSLTLLPALISRSQWIKTFSGVVILYVNKKIKYNQIISSKKRILLRGMKNTNILFQIQSLKFKLNLHPCVEDQPQLL